MSTAPRPENEGKRLEVLRRYGILDTLPESAFDELTHLAIQICRTSIGLIGFVDEERVWFKSRVGLEQTEVPRDSSFCTHALLRNELFIIEDAAQDSRFADNPMVKATPGVRFYAGMPLTTPDGFKIGVLCVLDHKTRRLKTEQKEALKILARQVSTQLELRRHLVSSARIIEEHKRTEEQLRTSEAFYYTLVETLPQNIFRKDVQGRFTFCNKQFCHSLGKRMEDIIGKTDYDFFPPELAAKYHRDDLRVMNTLENFETIEAHQTPSGEKLFVHVIKTPLYDALGAVIGIQGIFWDVTQSKRTEEALAYERDLLRGLLDNIPDRIYFKDVESRFLRCSTSMALRLGLADPKEVIGKTDYDFHPKEQAQEFYADEQRIILTGRPLVNKLERQVDTYGREIWASVTKVPIYNQYGHVTGIIGISRDITRLKQTELALQQARDAALESSRVKSQFLANMSHEIRTRMNAIVGMTGLLLDTRLTEEQREFVHTVRDSTQSLLGIINEILDYSKVESGKFTLEIIDFDLRDAVESTLEMLAETAYQKGIELVCCINHDVPQFLRGDPGRFRQILANFLSNAVKFTAKGEVVVRVSNADETETEVLIRISVQDTGIGIEPDALSRIFDAFTQADGSTTRKYGGTGLGLAISKQLVELMHGLIGVESEVGQGSTFWFQLPFAKQPLPCPSITPAENFTLAGQRILIIDDYPTQREILQHLLQPLKPAEVVALQPQQALQVSPADALPFHIVILDLGGVDKKTRELFQQVKAIPGCAQAHLVVLTSLGHRLSPAVMQEHGIAACLGKPLRSSRFCDCLQRVSQTGTAIDPATEPTLAEAGSQQPDTPVNLRILLAEDNAVNQRLALLQLRKLGYKADAVGNGVEVLDALQRIPYDIILMDCQMPEMDGYEVTRRLRQSTATTSGSGPKPYIIALTANALAGDREKCMAAGMNDYLLKPLHLVELDSALKRARRKVATGPRPDAAHPPPPDTLDLTIIKALRALREPNQPDPLKELVELFLRDAHVKLDKLTTGVPEKDAATVGATAHSLKGSSSNLGARRLALACANLEKKAKSTDWPEAANILLDVKSEFENVEQLLIAELQK